MFIFVSILIDPASLCLIKCVKKFVTPQFSVKVLPVDPELWHANIFQLFSRIFSES
jgi:hypothetical protein